MHSRKKGGIHSGEKTFYLKNRSICCKVYILVKKPKPSNLHYCHHSYTVPIKPTVSICETIHQSPLAMERSCCPRHRLISLRAHRQLQARLKKEAKKVKQRLTEHLHFGFIMDKFHLFLFHQRFLSHIHLWFSLKHHMLSFKNKLSQRELNPYM